MVTKFKTLSGEEEKETLIPDDELPQQGKSTTTFETDSEDLFPGGSNDMFASQSSKNSEKNIEEKSTKLR